MAQQLSTNTFGTAKWIVSATASDGTHTTIARALTSSSSGDTIFIRPGTYTENLTLKAGVNLTAFGCDSSQNGTGTVIISGTCTLTTAGSVSITGIQLQTNSAALLAVTGTLASVVNLFDCYLNCTNATGITYSSSSASSQINIRSCTGNLATTGIAYFAASGSGGISIYDSDFSNSGASTTANTLSAGLLSLNRSLLTNPLTTSSTGVLAASYASISVNNTTNLTHEGGATSFVQFCNFASGSASAVSISSTLLMVLCDVNSSNTNAITGAGTVNYSGITFSNTSKTINTTTQTSSGTLQGSKNTAPSAGFLGEQIRATIALGSAVNIPNNTATNVTSISLTPGIWDVSLLGEVNCAGSFTQVAVSISTTSATNGTPGDNEAFYSPAVAIVGQLTCLSIPSYRLTLLSTTTVYYVAFAVFTTSSTAAFGRISATRAG